MVMNENNNNKYFDPLAKNATSLDFMDFIIMLYDTASCSLEEARDRMVHKDIAGWSRAINRCRDITSGLQASTSLLMQKYRDTEIDFAPSLNQLLDQINTVLLRADAEHSPELIVEVSIVFKDLSSMWRKIREREEKKKLIRYVPFYGEKVREGKPYIPYIETHLCDHCNLDCRSCGHCSPLVTDETFANVEQFEKDLKELSSKNSLGRLRLMGGEPLLHPEVHCFFIIARKCFPTTAIHLVTNGILLPVMKENFWQAARESRIIFDISSYLVVADKLNDYIQLLKVKNIISGSIISCNYFGQSMNSNGNSNIEQAHKYCQSNVCHNLWNSKLYKCPFCYMAYFNKYFDENLQLQEGIDFYRLTGEEIRDALSGAIEQCKYCSTQPYIFEWTRSNKERKEWDLSLENNSG